MTNAAGDRAAVSDDSARGAGTQVHGAPRPALPESDPLHPQPAHRRLHADDDQQRPSTAPPRTRVLRFVVVNGRRLGTAQQQQQGQNSSP